MEFDNRDKVVIEALYHNWRMTSSELSKKVHLSRRQVDYRIKQYFSSNVIRTIFTVFDYSKLGYNKPAFAFIRLHNKKYISTIGKYLEDTKRCTSWGRVWTEYDIFSNLIFKNKKERSLFIRNIKNRFKSVIDEITFINPFHSELYPLKSIGNNLSEVYAITPKEHKKANIDLIDLKILKEISSNSRKSIVDIAENIKISPERCLYRLKRLHKEKIILGSRIQFVLKEAGYYATCLFIETEIDNKLIEKFKKLCKSNSSINSLIVSKKYPQILVQVFHKDEETLREVVEKVYSFIEDYKAKISLVELRDDMNVVNPLPFL